MFVSSNFVVRQEISQRVKLKIVECLRMNPENAWFSYFGSNRALVLRIHDLRVVHLGFESQKSQQW